MSSAGIENSHTKKLASPKNISRKKHRKWNCVKTNNSE